MSSVNDCDSGSIEPTKNRFSCALSGKPEFGGAGIRLACRTVVMPLFGFSKPSAVTMCSRCSRFDSASIEPRIARLRRIGA